MMRRMMSDSDNQKFVALVGALWFIAMVATRGCDFTNAEVLTRANLFLDYAVVLGILGVALGLACLLLRFVMGWRVGVAALCKLVVFFAIGVVVSDVGFGELADYVESGLTGHPLSVASIARCTAYPIALTMMLCPVLSWVGRRSVVISRS